MLTKISDISDTNINDLRPLLSGITYKSIVKEKFANIINEKSFDRQKMHDIILTSRKEIEELSLIHIYGKYFKDSTKTRLESQIGEVLIYMYNLSEELRLERVKREEEHKLWVEKQRLAEERKQRLEDEKRNTRVLLNRANDYEMACKIRTCLLYTSRCV